MISSTEFVKGKHNIGWVDSDFTKHFGDTEFSEKAIPTFQKLQRRMTDVEIESELNPGICELGDVFAFLKNAPEECKDGYWNLFYFPAFVVLVYWYAGGGVWLVLEWGRDGFDWSVGFRVFSPATRHSESKPSDLGDFVPRAEFEEWKKKVESVLKI